MPDDPETELADYMESATTLQSYKHYLTLKNIFIQYNNTTMQYSSGKVASSWWTGSHAKMMQTRRCTLEEICSFSL